MNQNKTIIGLQWGDEGKGKILDALADNTDYVVRYNGGGNAGHTVIVDNKKYVFHIIPSGILHSHITCIIGSGTVIDIEALNKEMIELKEKDISLANLKISPYAHIITKEHKLRDIEHEATKDAIGSTKKGIGPCYSDKIARIGLRLIDLYQYAPPELREILDFIKPFISDTKNILLRAIDENRSIIFEGAQGLMLDIDNGTYPYVTSSTTHPASAASSNGIPTSAIGEIIGISKAYCTRVGRGPFPTELHDETGELLRTLGKEFGSTTGRPRRCGWLDLVQLKYAVRMSGTEKIVLTKLDILAGMSKIKVCIEYKDHQTAIPGIGINWETAKPIYTELPGFPKMNWSEIKHWDQLPKEMRNYVKFIEKYLNGPLISHISLGPERESLIETQ